MYMGGTPPSPPPPSAPIAKFLETLDSVCLRAKGSPDKRMRAACSAEQCRDACFNLAMIKHYKDDFCCHFRRNDDPTSDAPHECAITPDGLNIDLAIVSTACPIEVAGNIEVLGNNN